MQAVMQVTAISPAQSTAGSRIRKSIRQRALISCDIVRWNLRNRSGCQKFADSALRELRVDEQMTLSGGSISRASLFEGLAMYGVE
jgi:hypothetical protein